MTGFVVPTTLATSEDYTTWTGGDAPANIDAVLRGCTTLVLNATKLALYPVDTTTGLSTDTATAAALRDATCIQAQAWVVLNIDPATGGVMTSAKTAKAKKIGTASVEYSDAEVQATVQARQAAYNSLVPSAAQHLQNRGLLSFAPRAARGPILGQHGWYWA